MREATIHKQLGSSRVEPNLPDLDAGRRSFTWASERAALDGLPGGGLNIAHEASTATPGARPGPGGDPLAAGATGDRREISLPASSTTATNRFANVLPSLGVAPGERVVRARRPRAGAVRRRARHA